MIQEPCFLIGYLNCSGTVCLSSGHSLVARALQINAIGYRKACHGSHVPNRTIHLLRNRREQALSYFGHDVNLRIDDFGDFVSHTGAEDHSDFSGVEFVLLLEPRR